jgi:hypothetical protein
MKGMRWTSRNTTPGKGNVFSECAH